MDIDVIWYLEFLDVIWYLELLNVSVHWFLCTMMACLCCGFVTWFHYLVPHYVPCFEHLYSH